MPGENVYRSTKAASRLARELQASTPHIPPETARQLVQLASAMQASTKTDSLEATFRTLREVLPSAESNAQVARTLRQLFNPGSNDESPASTKPQLDQGIVDKWNVLYNSERTWPDRRWLGKCPVSREEAQFVVRLRREGVPGERGGPNRGIHAVSKATKTKTNDWLTYHQVKWVYENFPKHEEDAVRSIWQAAQQPPR